MDNFDQITIIISPAVKDGNSYRVYGESIRETRNIYSPRKEAEAEILHNLEIGWLRVGSGLSIVVRPQYNDDAEGSFHEYRSFDGENFKLVSW